MYFLSVDSNYESHCIYLLLGPHPAAAEPPHKSRIKTLFNSWTGNVCHFSLFLNKTNNRNSNVKALEAMTVIHCSWSGWNVFTCPSRTLPPEVSTCEDGVLNPAAGRAHLLQSDPVQSSSDGQLRQPLKLSETHQNTNPFLWSSAGIIQLQWYYHTATNNALSYAFQLRYQTVNVLRKKTSYGNVIYDMYCSVTQVILPYMSPIKQYIIFIYIHVLSGWVCVSLAGLIMHCVYDCDWSTYCSYWSCVVLNWIMLELSVFSWLINRLKY